MIQLKHIESKEDTKIRYVVYYVYTNLNGRTFHTIELHKDILPSVGLRGDTIHNQDVWVRVKDRHVLEFSLSEKHGFGKRRATWINNSLALKIPITELRGGFEGDTALEDGRYDIRLTRIKSGFRAYLTSTEATMAG